MKIINIKMHHYVLLIFLLGFYGCSKNTDQDVLTGGTTKLVFKNVQISDNQGFIKSASITASNELLEASESATAATNMKSGLGFSSEVFAEQRSIQAENTSESSTKLSSKGKISKIASTSPMSSGYTYRVLLYNTKTNKLFKSILAKSGETFEIEVNKGDKYKWYAYSYNDNETIPEPLDMENPSIEMSINKDFLYDDGEIDVLGPSNGQLNTYPINIVFDHKVAQVKVKVDASSLAQVANIEQFKVSFLRDDYLKKGVFSIKGNSISNLEVVPTSLVFNTIETSNIWEKSYYTADPSSLSAYQINIEDLTVNFFLANANSRINLATHDPANPPKFIFGFTAPAEGQQLTGIAYLNYVLQSRRIFHVSNGTSYAYAFEEGPSWQMINNLKNFGNLPESLVKMLPYAAGQGVWKGGRAIDNKLSNWVNANGSSSARIVSELSNVNTRPDILITAYNQLTYTPAVINAIDNFVNAGGVYIMLNEFNNSDISDMLNRLFNTTGMSARAGTNAGAMYPLLQTEDNDRVLNGPFGDARGKLWGEDASVTHGVTGLPANSALIYSYGQAINRSPNAANAAMVTMFKHKTKNFFYLGDGGLISYNGGTSSTICPFDYNPATGKPIPKLYGNSGNGYSSRSQYAYNGIIAGNVMLWAGAIAEFNGIRPWKYGQ